MKLTVSALAVTASLAMACGSNDETSENPAAPEGPYLALNAARVTAGTCSPTAIEIRGKDCYQRIPATADVSVTFTASGTTVYADNKCTVANGSQITIPKESAFVTLWLKGSKGDETTLSATASGFDPVAAAIVAFTDAAVKADTEVIRFSPMGEPTSSTITSSSCEPLTVRQVVSGDTFPTTASTNLELALSATIGKFYSDYKCTTEMSSTSWEPGGNFVMVWYKAGNAGTSTITVTSTIGTKTLALTVQ